MKKFVSVLCFVVCSMLIFAGCGVVGSSAVSGIKFVRDVFYVDKGVETFLDYRIYPSTAQSYSVSYMVSDEIGAGETYIFHDGYFTIRKINDDALTTEEAFKPITITVSLNQYTDTCEVMLREYPKSAGFFDDEGNVMESDTVFGGLTYVLGLKGDFREGQRSVRNNEFTYKITSSNPNIIAVKDEQSLLVQSTGKRGSSLITVQICNTLGEPQPDCTASITLNVVDAVEKSFVTFGNYAIKDGDKLDLSVSEGDEFEVQARYFSEKSYLIPLAEYSVFVTDENFFNVEKVENGYKLTVKEKTDMNRAGGTFDIVIQTTDIDSSGKPVKIKITVQLQFLE